MYFITMTAIARCEAAMLLQASVKLEQVRESKSKFDNKGTAAAADIQGKNFAHDNFEFGLGIQNNEIVSD